jgi:hypothetical protein
MDCNGTRRKTVETVFLVRGASVTRLKPGANERTGMDCLTSVEP